MANKLKLTSLRQAREINGWSRQYVAEQVGVDLATIGRWERGERMPHPHYRQQICELYQKNALELGLHSKGHIHLEEIVSRSDTPEELVSKNDASNPSIFRNDTSIASTSQVITERDNSPMIGALRESIAAQSNRPARPALISLKTITGTLALFGGSLLFLDLLSKFPRLLNNRH